MAIPHSEPMRFTPRGLTDASDSTDAFKGACQALANLIFDDANPEQVIARPGVVTLAKLQQAGINNPTFISVHVSVGTRVYGMVASSRIAGHDEPFCYDTATNSLVVISGITGATTPLSVSSSGDWTPPCMASIGDYIIVTHPGYTTLARCYGAIKISTMAITSQNTATNGLTAIPSSVANLNNRAYFGVENRLEYSNVLDPLTRTAATQSLTMGDTSNVTALAGLPIQTTSSGVIGALVVFKSTQVWQVSGDSTTSDLSQNFLSLTYGTLAPRSVALSPAGIYFLAASGPYIVDPIGAVRPVTNRLDAMESDVQEAFINATTPSRWAACYGASLYRICGPTVINGLKFTNDYWFHEKKRRWTGPHSFVYDCASQIGSFFVLTSAINPGLLMQSQATQKLNSVFTDLGAPYNAALLTSTFPKTGDMAIKQVVESQVELGGLPLGSDYVITAQDSQGNELNRVTISVSAANLAKWGDGTVWGTIAQGGSGKVWSPSQPTAPKTYPVPWTEPLVFEKLQLAISSLASSAVKIGTFYARYQHTGYMVTDLQG